MIQRFFSKFASKFKEQSPTVRGFILLAIILLIGIIIRWGYIMEEIGRGFKFFNR